jgi:hypothetical protein
MHSSADILLEDAVESRNKLHNLRGQQPTEDKQVTCICRIFKVLVEVTGTVSGWLFTCPYGCMTATGVCLRVETERRSWQRLPLAIPVFIRAADRHGNEFRELTCAIDISAGGALVAVRHDLKVGGRLKLEIPCVPMPDTRRQSSRSQILPARVLRSSGADYVRRVALKFTKSLIPSTT